MCVLNRRVEIYMCRSYLFSDDPVMHRSSPYDHLSIASDPRGDFFKRSLLSLESTFGKRGDGFQLTKAEGDHLFCMNMENRKMRKGLKFCQEIQLDWKILVMVMRARS